MYTDKLQPLPSEINHRRAVADNEDPLRERANKFLKLIVSLCATRPGDDLHNWSGYTRRTRAEL